MELDKERQKAIEALQLIRKHYNRYQITHAIDLSIELLKGSYCTGCQKENCQWRHCAPPEQKPINWGDMEP